MRQRIDLNYSFALRNSSHVFLSTEQYVRHYREINLAGPLFLIRQNINSHLPLMAIIVYCGTCKMPYCTIHLELFMDEHLKLIFFPII